MIRSLPLLLLAPIAAGFLTGVAEGRGQRGGGGGRGAQNVRPVEAASARGTQPQRGAQPQRGGRGGGGGQGRRTTEIIILPAPGFYGSAYADSFGLTTGFYPLGEWPAPVLATPFISASNSNRTNNSAGNANLQAEVNRLSREVEQLRAQTARPLPASVAPPPVGGNGPAVTLPPVAVPAPPVPERTLPATILVLRDGRRLEAQNYAIAGETFIILDEGKVQRIPVADIDQDASEKENRSRGVRFLAADR